jgi:hypothetical protein
MFLSFYLNHDFLAVLDPERHFFPVLQLQSISDSLGYAQYQIAPDLANLDAERLFPDLVQQQNSLCLLRLEIFLSHEYFSFKIFCAGSSSKRKIFSKQE